MGKIVDPDWRDRRALQDGEEGELTDDEQDWRARPWARTFDLISGQYGWTDDQILDLPIGRIWQIRDAILARLAWEHERYVRVVEAQTRFLVGAAHGSVGSTAMARAVRGVKFLVGRRGRRTLPRFEDVPAAMGVSPAEVAAAQARGAGHGG